MYCATNIFIIGIALPNLILAKTAVAKNGLVRCEDTTVTEAGDKFFQCFKDMVEHTINDTHKDCKEVDSTLVSYATLADTSCYKKNRTDRGVVLKSLIEYSVNRGVFNDFVANDGPVCINDAKEKIRKCVTAKVGRLEGDNQRYKLWRNSIPVLQKDTCKKAVNLKMCVLDAIRASKTCSKNPKFMNLETYVNSLFEFVLVKCAVRGVLTPSVQAPKLPPLRAQLPPFEPPTNASGNVTTLVAVILALVVISMLYVVVRDCRNRASKQLSINP